MPYIKDHLTLFIYKDLARRRTLEMDSIIGHGRRRKQAHDEHHDWIGIRRGRCPGCKRTFTFLSRAFELARSKPRHLVPQSKTPITPRAGLDGLIDSLLAAQHVLEMFRRTLPNDTSRHRLDRLSNRLTKIVTEARNLATP